MINKDCFFFYKIKKKDNLYIPAHKINLSSKKILFRLKKIKNIFFFTSLLNLFKKWYPRNINLLVSFIIFFSILNEKLYFSYCYFYLKKLEIKQLFFKFFYHYLNRLNFKNFMAVNICRRLRMSFDQVFPKYFPKQLDYNINYSNPQLSYSLISIKRRRRFFILPPSRIFFKKAYRNKLYEYDFFKTYFIAGNKDCFLVINNKRLIPYMGLNHNYVPSFPLKSRSTW
jgi:hypothetical protein